MSSGSAHRDRQRHWQWHPAAQREMRKNLSPVASAKLMEVIGRYLRGEERPGEVKSMPGVKGLWEVAVQADRGWPRVLFHKEGTSCTGLTAFMKKTNKTEKDDLKRARGRM